MPKSMFKRGSDFSERYMPVTESGCWLWIGARDVHGYGYWVVRGENRKAHRISWEVANGPIPEGMSVCHKCDTPACVNPAHLFIGAQRDNSLDMVTKGRCRSGLQHKRKMHCIRGHEFTAANTQYRNGHMRECRACNAIRQAKCRLRRKQK